MRESEEESFIMEGIENEYLKMLEKRQNGKKLGLELPSTSGDEGSDREDSTDNFDAERSFTGSIRSMDDESLNLEEDLDAINYYILTLKPQKIYKFELIFTP